MLAIRDACVEEVAAIGPPVLEEKRRSVCGTLEQVLDYPEEVEEELWLDDTEFAWKHDPSRIRGSTTAERADGKASRHCGCVYMEILFQFSYLMSKLQHLIRFTQSLIINDSMVQLGFCRNGAV